MMYREGIGAGQPHPRVTASRAVPQAPLGSERSLKKDVVRKKKTSRSTGSLLALHPTPRKQLLKEDLAGSWATCFSTVPLLLAEL